MEKQKIKVVIKCYQKVEYQQHVEVTEEEYLKLIPYSGDDVGSRRSSEIFKLIQDLIDPNDIIDTDEEYQNFEIWKNKDN